MNFKKNFRFKILMALSIVMILSSATQAQANLKIGQPAPDIEISEWLLNKPRKKSLKNKFIILDFWATWCKPCLEGVPQLNEFQAKFADRNIIFLSMTYESKKTAEAVFDNVNFETPVVNDVTNQTFLNFGDGVRGIAYYPMAVLIDDQNIVRWFGSSENLTEDMIEDFLNYKDIDIPQLSNDSPLAKVQDREELMSREFSMELWSDMFMDPSITRITYIEEVPDAIEEKNSSVTMGNGGFFEQRKLKSIFMILWPDKKFVIPEAIADKLYNFYYLDKEVDADSQNRVITEMMDQLNLKVEKKNEKGSQYHVKLVDKSLLVKSKVKGLVPIKMNDGKLILPKNTIAGLVSNLSSRTEHYWTFNQQSVARFSFEIDMSSLKSIKSSLWCYGLEVVRRKRKVDVYYILNN